MFTYAAVLLSLAIAVSGHSYLVSPRPDWVFDGDRPRRPECRVGHPTNLRQYDSFCPGPCVDDRTFYNPDAQVTELHRGQMYHMEWTRNNHEHGFSRFSLVPMSDRMDKSAHKKYAFRYSCWNIGSEDCQGSVDCGTDKSRKKYSTDVEIPTSYPNGDYVLGWSWYGGASGGGSNFFSDFGDYYSCAYVRIVGKEPVEESYTPKFISGFNGKKTCFSAVNRLGVCAREPCNNPRYPASEMIPAGFENNNTPPDILARDFGYNGPFQNNPNSFGDGNRGVTDSSPPGNSEKYQGTIANTAIESPVGVGRGSFTSFQLVDSRNGAVIQEISQNTPNNKVSNHINISAGNAINNLTIRVLTAGAIEEVTFYLNGKKIRTERIEPYFISPQDEPWREMPINQIFILTVIATSGGELVDMDIAMLKVQQ